MLEHRYDIRILESYVDPNPLMVEIKDPDNFTRGEFNNASASKRSLYWCQALHITNKDRYQSTSARRALALLNSPLFPDAEKVLIGNSRICL